MTEEGEEEKEVDEYNIQPLHSTLLSATHYD